MADYTQNTDFSAKDTLPADDPEKIILGSDVDEEFSRIATAIQTKYDDADLASQSEAEAGSLNTKLMTPLRVAQRTTAILASQAEAEAGSDNTKLMTPLRVAQRTTSILASQAQAEAESSNVVLMTPLRVANWADANAGIVGDLQALTDPNADRLLGWDDSAGAATNFTVGSGLRTTATPSIEVDIAGQTGATPAGADSIMIYDDSAGAVRKTTITDILAVGAPASNVTYKRLTTDQTINTTTLTTVTGLSFAGPFSSGDYYAVEIVLIINNATTHGVKVEVIPADPIDNTRGIIAQVSVSTSSASGGNTWTLPSSTAGAANGNGVADLVGSFVYPNIIHLTGFVKVLSGNTLGVQLASNTGPNSFSVVTGSYAKYEKL